MQTLKPKPYFPVKIRTHSNLQFFAAPPYTHRSDQRVPTHQTDKQRKSKKKKAKTENLCSFSATVKTENLCSFSATTGDLEAIPSLLFNNRQFRRQVFFPPFFDFYSTTVSRVFKNIWVQQKVGRFLFPIFLFSIQLPFLGF